MSNIRRHLWVVPIIIIITLITVGSLGIKDLPELSARRPEGTLRLVGELAAIQGFELVNPLDVAVDGDGRVYVADAGNNQIKVFGPKGNLLMALGGGGYFDYPNAVAVGPDYQLYVGEFRKNRIQVIDLLSEEKDVIQVIDEEVAGQPLEPLSLAVGTNGRIFVADRRGAVLILNAQGHVERSFEQLAGTDLETFSFPNGIAHNWAGLMAVTDSNHRRVLLLDTNGNLLKEFNHENLVYPRGVGFAGEEQLIVADALGKQLVLLNPNFEVTAVAAVPGELIVPEGIATNGELVYVTDRMANRVLIFRLKA